MATTEDISLRVALDDRQAKAGLDALRAQTDAVAQAADAGAGGMEAFKQRVDGVNKLAGPAASAISGVTGAVGGLSSQAGAAVGAVANLAGAFASGGPLALGIVAIGTGISWLTAQYAESAKAAEQSEKAQTDAINSIIKDGLGPLESAINDLASAQSELQLNRLLTGDDSDQVLRAMAPIRIELEKLQLQINASQRDLQKFKAESVRGIRTGESLDQYKEARSLAEKEAEAVSGRIQLLQQALFLRAQEINAVNESVQIEQKLIKQKKDKEKAERDHEKALQESKRRLEEQHKMIQEAAAAVGPTREMFEQDINQRAVQARQEAERALIEADRARAEADKARTEQERKEAEERKKIAEDETKKKEEELKVMTDKIMTATSIVVNSSDQLISDLITGQDKALERFGVSIFKQAGTVMLGKGIETTAIGIGNVAVGNPIGAGQIATGSALIAGGLALGAVATGFEHVAINGGQIGQALPSDTKDEVTSTPMGAGRISGRQADGGGNRQEAITYVFNAPVFGDQNRSAKHVAQLQRRARRDLLLA